MADDEKDIAPFRGAGERLARLEEKMLGALGQKDAHTLMEYSRAGDERILTSVGERINEFRSEVRDAFRHSEKENSAATYKATTESEARVMAAFQAAMLSLENRLPIEKSGVHSIVPYGIGGTGGAGLLYLLLSLFGLVPHPGGN